jgi:hypothetical protein
MAYASGFEYAICVIPTVEFRGLASCLRIPALCRDGSNKCWHFIIPNIVPSTMMYVCVRVWRKVVVNDSCICDQTRGRHEMSR